MTGGSRRLQLKVISHRLKSQRRPRAQLITSSLGLGNMELNGNISFVKFDDI